jgi:membrane protein DedA with SNARE-associated domain
MDNLITGEKAVEEKAKSSRYATVGAGALILLACVIPIAVQKYLVIDPAVIGMVGISMIILLGFVGSATVVIPVPVLPLVFTGAAVLNPIGLVIAAAASITAGMAVCYVLGRRGHSRATRVAESQANLPKPISNLYSWSTDNVGTASFLIAATPNPMFDYAGLIAGASRLDARKFLAGTFAGKITQASVIAFLGHTLGERLFTIL